MNLRINIKSGTGGYNDPDGCDMLIKYISGDNLCIPRIGETIKILTKVKPLICDVDMEVIELKVIDIVHDMYGDANDVTVYVMPIGWRIN